VRSTTNEPRAIVTHVEEAIRADPIAAPSPRRRRVRAGERDERERRAIAAVDEDAAQRDVGALGSAGEIDALGAGIGIWIGIWMVRESLADEGWCGALPARARARARARDHDQLR
jgi:hypothetical protein